MQTQEKIIWELKLIRYLLCLILIVLVAHFGYISEELAIVLGGAVFFLGILWLIVVRPVLNAYNTLELERPDQDPVPDAISK